MAAPSIIQHYVDAHISHLSRTAQTTTPNLVTALWIRSVAENCPAQQIGLSKGDYLISVGGQPAVSVNLKTYPLAGNKCKYVYFLKQSNELLELESDGLPLGETFAKTPESILQTYRGLSRDPNDLVTLWDQTQDDALMALAQKMDKRNALWLDKYLPHQLSHAFVIRETEILFYGVACIESGRYEQGLHYIQRYLNEYRYNWTTNFAGIALFYWGEALIKSGSREDGIDCLKEAYDAHPVNRIKRRLTVLGEMTLNNNEQNAQRHQQFPLYYQFPLLKNPAKTGDLSAYLASMKTGQFLIVCSLGPYRSNGPYDDFMQRFIQLSRFFGDVFIGLNVITGGERNPNWLEHEERALSLGMNVALLSDPDCSLMAALSSRGSPDILVLDSSGAVVLESSLESDDDVWRLILQAKNQSNPGYLKQIY